MSICDRTFGISVVCKHCGGRMIVHKCFRHNPKIPAKCPHCGKRNWVKLKKKQNRA
ncbi:hypothetical protein HYT45_01150 [Candidatus Uhrbacteria bacterium]|nr:hypothetical protein [Candidatus Uhrbacteria bacterium]